MSDGNSWGGGWGGQIFPYVKNTQVFKCPDSTNTDIHQTPPNPKVYAENYIMNANLTTNTSRGHGTMINGNTVALTAPTMTICLTESEGTYGYLDDPSTKEDGLDGTVEPSNRYVSPTTVGTRVWGDNLNGSGCNGRPCWLQTGALQNVTNWASNTTVAGSSPNGFPVEGWHMTGCNYLLADGHVKWFKGTQVSAGTDSSTPTSAQTVAASPTAAGTQNGIYAATFSTK